MDTKFVVFSCGHNCEKYISGHIRSIHNQTYLNFTHVLVDDASYDSTASIANKAQFSRLSLHQNINNIKWIRNAMAYLDEYIESDEDVIVLVDADDYLAKRNVLWDLNNIYQQKNCWMTYSLFVDAYGRVSNWIPPYTKEIREKKLYRSSVWSFTHLRTFKAFLWHNLNKEDLKDPEGGYAKYAYDRFLLMPMLEMSSPDKITFIPEVQYVYNNDNPFQVEKINRSEQERMAAYVNQKSKYEAIQR